MSGQSPIEALYSYYDPAGNLAYQAVRLRPKRFQMRRPADDGSWIYNMEGQERYLYRSRELANSEEELVTFCEGEKDADRLADLGFVSTAIAGGTSGPIPGALTEQLSGRRVAILADNDAPGKRFASKIKRQLTKAGVACAIVELPDLPEAGDVSDWLDAGNSRVELQRHIAQSFEIPNDTNTAGDNATESAWEDRADVMAVGPNLYLAGGRFVERRVVNDAERFTDITNFDLYIDRERRIDDGMDIRREFEIAGRLVTGDDLAVQKVPAKEFAGMSWTYERFGARMWIAPGSSVRDKVRSAIQIRSQIRGIDEVTVYAHTGWLPAKRMYLHAGGGMDASGLRRDVVTDLPGALRNYELQEIPNAEALSAATAALMKFREIGPTSIAALPFCAPWAAVLGCFVPVDFGINLHGATGVFKTEFAALMCGFFGHAVNPRNYGASATSTIFSLETESFAAKDTLFAVDDVNPDGSRADRERKRAELNRLFRSTGNQSGRNRGMPDGSVRNGKYPRGLPLVTGEALETNESATGRSLAIEISKGDIKAAVLTDLQACRAAGHFVRIMSAFVGYVARNWERIGVAYREQVATDVAAFRQQPTAHMRNPQSLGVLSAAAVTFVDAMRDMGAMDEESAMVILRTVDDGLMAICRQQDEAIEQADPIRTFLQLLRSALLSGQAHLATPQANDDPPFASVLGWKKETVHTGGFSQLVFRAQGPRIGWIDDRGLFLNPDAAMAVVQAFDARQGQGSSIPWRSKTLGKRLKESGYLLSCETGKNVQKILVAGSAERVWHLDASHVLNIATDDERELSRVDSIDPPLMRGVA